MGITAPLVPGYMGGWTNVSGGIIYGKPMADGYDLTANQSTCNV